jgi:cytoskeletal protein RodZ
MPDDVLNKENSEIFKNIGKKISQKRKQKRRKIQRISKKLNISTDFLSLIEEGNFLKMPKHVPRLGFVKSYARYLGVDISSELSEMSSITVDAVGSKGEFVFNKDLKRFIVFLLFFIFCLIILLLF